jgi:hypothetical protein
MAQIIIGNTSFNSEAFINISKEDFFAMHKGKVTFDLNEAWELIVKELPKEKENATESEIIADEPNRGTSKKHKKVKY